MIHHALLIHQGRLVFPYFDFILDLSSCVHRSNIYVDLLEVKLEKKAMYMVSEIAFAGFEKCVKGVKF